MQHRGATRRHPRPEDLPPLTLEQILGWADEHHARTGRWPNATSGPVHPMPGETWSGIVRALKRGERGLSVNRPLGDLIREHWYATRARQANRTLDWLVAGKR